MRTKDLLHKAKQELKLLNISTPDLDAEVLIAKAVGKDRLNMLTTLDDTIAQQQLDTALQFIEQRKQYMPIAYILREKDFWKHTFYVDERVLIPRPESEAFLELALKYFTDKESPLKILDLGSGSGCLGISVLKEYKNATCLFADIELPALQVAMKNALSHNVSDRSNFVNTDWFSNIHDTDFDLILSNPPYVDKAVKLSDEVYNYEPHSALFGELKGSQPYIQIAIAIDKYLSQDGFALFEIGFNHFEDILAILKSNNNLEYVEVLKDLNGIKRCLSFKRKNI